MSLSNPSLRTKLKERFIEWATSSTSHGFPNIFRANNIFIKLMWLLFLICSSAMCGFMVVRSIMDYLSFDVVTKVRVYSEVPSEFPTITICNINPFAKNESIEAMKDIYIREYPNASRDEITLDDLTNVYRTFLYEAMDHSFGYERKRSLTPDITDMLLYCSFNNNGCTYNNFSSFYMLFFGNCFRFNSGQDYFGDKAKVHKIYREGLWAGLALELFLPANKQFMLNSYDSGFKIFIDNSSSLLTTFSQGILVETGKNFEISLHKMMTERLPYPYSDCQKDYPDDPVYSKYKINGESYREKDCVFLCLQKQIVEKCHCYDSWYDMPFDKSYGPCLSESEQDCCNEFFFDLYEKGKSEECSSLCKVECSFISYETSISSSNYPTAEYSNYLDMVVENLQSEGVSAENITYELIKSRVVSLYIYLNDLYYSKISEVEKFNLVDLIANIGLIFFLI